MVKKTICLIAARGGSKGIKRKNLRVLGNKPLIAHTIEKAIKSKLFDEVIVSTEDEEILKISKEYGAEIPFLRPKSLATDNADMDKVILHAIKKLKSIGYDFDVLVNLDCTVPFLRIEDIANTIKILRNKKCDGVYGVYRQHHNPYFNMMELNSRGFLEFSKKLKKRIKNRQDAPIVYQLNGLFGINVNQFLKTGKRYTEKIVPFEIAPETGLMIDTEFEFELAKTIVEKKLLII